MNDKVREALGRLGEFAGIECGLTQFAVEECIATIRAYIEGLEADARRYRWLRDDAPDAWDVSQWIDTDTQAIHMQDDLDAAIDSAMQENRDG